MSRSGTVVFSKKPALQFNEEVAQDFAAHVT
jgi:hypothetical protein